MPAFARAGIWPYERNGPRPKAKYQRPSCRKLLFLRHYDVILTSYIRCQTKIIHCRWAVRLSATRSKTKPFKFPHCGCFVFVFSFGYCFSSFRRIKRVVFFSNLLFVEVKTPRHIEQFGHFLPGILKYTVCSKIIVKDVRFKSIFLKYLNSLLPKR